MTYDTTGKRRRTENLVGQVTATTWDCCHKVSETQPDGAVTTWDYDDGDRMGRRVAQNDQRFVYNGYMQIADNKRIRRRQ